jgi:hypothetical protein
LGIAAGKTLIAMTRRQMISLRDQPFVAPHVARIAQFKPARCGLRQTHRAFGI